MDTKIGIVGAGAVGIFLAVRLGRHHRVHLLCRSQTRAPEYGDGLAVITEDRTCEVASANVTVHTEADDVGPCPIVFLCTKAPVPRRSELGALVNDESVVVPLSNGIEHVAAALEDYPDLPVAGCIRIFAELDRSSPGVVKQHGVVPNVRFGPLLPQLNVVGAESGQASRRVEEAMVLVQTALTKGNVLTECVNDIEDELWRKFVFITTMSAIGSASHVPLKEVYRQSPNLFRSVVKECCEVATSANSYLSPDEAMDTLHAIVENAREDVTVSMQRDMLSGRPSELDHQLGAMIRIGAKNGVLTPTLNVLHGLLVPREVALSSRKAPESGEREGEREARCTLALLHRLVDHYGMSDLFVTHISLAIPGKEAFLVSPFGVLFSQVTASSLVKVSRDGEILSSGAPDKKGWSNETAVRIHAPLQRKGHGCVLHTHTAAGNVVSCTESGLQPWTQKAMLAIPFVRYHDYGALALGDDHEGDTMSSALGDEGRILVLRNHGLLTVGRNACEAFLWMEWMEQACKYQVQLMSQVTTLVRPKDAARDTTYRQSGLLGPGGAMDFADLQYWRSLEAQMASLAPGRDWEK
jgi:2-dehydropantoate 2-reductase